MNAFDRRLFGARLFGLSIVRSLMKKRRMIKSIGKTNRLVVGRAGGIDRRRRGGRGGRGGAAVRVGAGARRVVRVGEILRFHTVGRRPHAGIRPVSVPRVGRVVARRGRGQGWSSVRLRSRFHRHSCETEALR